MNQPQSTTIMQSDIQPAGTHNSRSSQTVPATGPQTGTDSQIRACGFSPQLRQIRACSRLSVPDGQNRKSVCVGRPTAWQKSAPWDQSLTPAAPEEIAS